jgi:hypothetical protein
MSATPTPKCSKCDQPRFKSGLCWDHLREYKRNYTAARRAAGDSWQRKNTFHDHCRKCGGQRDAKSTTAMCGPCRRAMQRDYWAKNHEKWPKPKPAKPIVRSKPVRVQRPVFLAPTTPVVIGPQAYEKPAPVRGKVTVLPSVFAAEAEARRAEWDAWFTRRVYEAS